MSRLAALLSAFLCLAAATSQAGEVELPYRGIVLNANLELAEGRSLADGVVLVVHDTLADYTVETVSGLQRRLGERGHSSLAINLSLGVDDRHGTYDCATFHTHRHTDAIDEIGAWLDWLVGRGGRRVVLLGHSRGANQGAWFVRKRDHPTVRKVVLVAPMTWSLDRMADRYKERFGTPLFARIGRAASLVLGGKGETVLEEVDFLDCPRARVTADSFFGYYRNDPWFDTPEMLDGIDLPVLVVAGSADKAFPDLAGKVEGKRIDTVRLRVIAGAGRLFEGAHAERLADIVAGFIEGPE